MSAGQDELAHLVRDANRIAAFFEATPDPAEARAGVAAHLRRYWAPVLRRRLLDHLAQGGEGLDPLAREALQALGAEADAPR